MATNVNISGTLPTFCSESDISISAANPNQIISASNATLNQEQFWSGDGGATWQQTILQFVLTDVNHTDPGVNWTKDGTAWSTVLGMQATPNFICRLYKSTDGGGTWNLDSTPSGAQAVPDRQTLWVDRSPSSPHYDNMYMIWHNGAPCFVVARQGPVAAWSAPKQVSAGETTGATTGGDIKTNENGHVFAFWPDDGSRSVFFAKSTDGGVNFSAGALVTNTFGAFKVPIPAQAKRQAALYLSGGAYSGAGKDMVYVCRTDLAGGAGCSVESDAPGGNVNSTCKTRIWFSRSSNGGANWDASFKINDQGSLNDQFFPRLAVDSATGRLVVVYYDTVADPGRVKADLWMQTSDDYGATWSGAVRVTDASTDETASASDVFNDQFGDYIGLSTAAGRFFACWTDRRSGGKEQIWGAQLAIPAMAFVVEKSTFGQDEVAAHASYPSAFWLEMDGFANKTLGFNGPGDLSNNPPNPAPVITATVDPLLNPGLNAMQIATIAANLPAVTFGPTPIIAADPTLQQDLQRFMYPYTIAFANNNAFNALNAHQTAIVTLQASFTAGLTTLTATAAIELAKGEDPYVTDVNPQHPADFPFWLSYDLRFFKVTPSQPHQMFSVPNPADASGAVTYIQTVLQHLNTPALILNGDTFENTLQQGESESSLEFLPKNATNELTFNFAVARVRILGNSATSVFPVRVFFRLFQAQTTSSDFNENSTYRWGTDGTADHKIALLGVQNDQNGNPEYVTIPCFATERVNLTVPTDMHAQHDDPNAQKITTVPGVEVDTYFGCWLDVNQPQQKFLIPTPPAAKAQWDGPWPGTQSVSGAITVSPHQCLIAEIRFDDTPVPAHATSATSDKLAQRNIAWIDGPNPGTAPSRIMAHPFDVRASDAALPDVDELMITWGNTPAGSTASLYFPALDAADIVALATRMYPSHRLTASDPNTIACPASGTTYIPVPKGDGRYAGLLSVNLPAGIRRGDFYDIAIRQLTRAVIGYKRDSESSLLAVGAAPAPKEGTPFAWRRLLGAFQITIKISTKEQLLYPEERLLAWLKWRLEVTPHESRWYPVLLRYSHVVGGRVGSWGGNPGTIPPSPEGNVPGHKPQPPGHPGEGHHKYCGKVAGIFYDQFGDFEGFVLKTEHGREHWFSGCEREIEALVNRAWCERIVICVFVERHKPKYPVAIELRRPGECCDVRGHEEHEEHEGHETHERHEREEHEDHETHERREEHEEHEEHSPLERLESFGKRLLLGRREEPEKHEHEHERERDE